MRRRDEPSSAVHRPARIARPATSGPLPLRGYLAALLCLTLLHTGCRSEEDRAAVHARRGEEFAAQDRWGDAIIEYRSALSFQPRSLEAHWRLGAAYLEEGLLEEAKFYYREAHQIAPESDEAALALADLLADVEPRRSQELLEEVLERNPENARAHVVRAELALLRREIAGAIRDATRAVELAPEDPAGYWKLQRIYESQLHTRHRSGRPSKPRTSANALANYERLLELDPDRRPEILLGRARTLPQKGPKQAQTAQAYRDALSAALESGEFRQIQRAASDSISFATAAEDRELHEFSLQQLVDVTPHNLSAWATLADLLARRGEPVDELFRNLIEYRPKDPTAHILYARHLEATQDVNAAIRYLEQQIGDKVDPSSLLSAIAELQIDAGRWEDFDRTLVRMREEFPHHWRTTALSANQALSQGELEEAAAILRRLAKLHREPRLLLRLAVVELALRRYDGAAAAAQLAVTHSTGIPIQAKRLLAQIQHDAGKCASAIKTLGYLERYDELTMDDELRFARCSYRTGNPTAGREVLEQILSRPDPPVEAVVEFARHEKANAARRPLVRAELERALERSPNHPDLVAQIASIELSRGQYRRAIDRLAEAIEEHHNSVQLRMLRARANSAQGDARAAAGDARIALANDPDLTSGASQLLVALVVASGSIDQFTDVLEQSLAHDRSASSLALLAQLYAMQGRTDEARTAYTRVLERNPKLVVVKNDLAYLLARERTDLQRALSLAKEATLSMGDDPSVNDTLGYVYLQMGHYPAALRQFQTAAILVQRPSAEIQYHIALALKGMGRDERALRAFQNTLLIDPKFPDAAAVQEQIDALIEEKSSAPRRS